MRVFVCPGYNDVNGTKHFCGRKIKVSTNRKRCAGCAKRKLRVNSEIWCKDNPEKRNATRRAWIKTKPERWTSYMANWCLRDFLRLLGLPKDYPIRELISDSTVSDKKLEEITKGGGYPDWAKECIEEKKLHDRIRPGQWARAILEYRAGRQYKIAWRFTSTRRKVFGTIFDFHEWRMKRKEKL